MQGKERVTRKSEGEGGATMYNNMGECRGSSGDPMGEGRA